VCFFVFFFLNPTVPSLSLRAHAFTHALPLSPLSTYPHRYWDSPDDSAAASYCIIESRESVKDFAGLGVAEVRAAISARRNKIYFLMEEVRRLRIQERLKEAAADADGGEAAPPPLPDETMEPFPSALPFFPPLKDGTLATYTRFYGAAVAAIIVFGGLLAPVLEVKLGLGGSSYADVIRGAHLPAQLADVDPIVASFCGGAVGVLTALLIVEVNNAAVNTANRCAYCAGTGYVTCGACGGAGVPVVFAAAGGGVATSVPSSSSSSPGEPCATCSGTGKVACIACLCTGKKVAREGDPRLDPFS